jgi:hypothetical protein
MNLDYVDLVSQTIESIIQGEQRSAAEVLQQRVPYGCADPVVSAEWVAEADDQCSSQLSLSRL